MKSFFQYIRTHEWLTVLILALVFIAIRLPGTGLPLHQDEYKWPMIVNPANVGDVSIPHPPLSQFIYRTAGYIVGFDTHFRFVPLFFGTLNLLLLYYFVRMLFSRRETIVASVIWIFLYFSVLASLMVDTDGEIMPFFFLLALIGYYKLRSPFIQKKWPWAVLFVVACILGFLVKVSFLLAVCAIGADYLWSQRHLLSRRDIARYGAYLGGIIVGLVLILLVAKAIFPFFNLRSSISYWEHFAVGNRNWFQTLIQCIKALLYTSPFLVFVPLFAKKDSFSKVRPFIFFLIFSFIFYVILFDFSLGALDRYLQLVVLPLTVLSAIIIAPITQNKDMRTREFVLLGLAVGLILVLLQSLPHYVPPLHPKAEWISRFVHFKWNFLYPFSGGSGPLGFYVSFLFMSLAWIISLGAVLYAKYKPQYAKVLLAFLIPIGLIYNGVFIEEYLVGYWNGSAPRLLEHAVAFIAQDPDIQMVTTYNDNGGNEIRAIGKYRKRLYVDPAFDLNDKIQSLNTYKEHYFVLDVPRIDPQSVYQKYFDSCTVVYRETDRQMSATIYDCRKVPDIQINS